MSARQFEGKCATFYFIFFSLVFVNLFITDKKELVNNKIRKIQNKF